LLHLQFVLIVEQEPEECDTTLYPQIRQNINAFSIVSCAVQVACHLWIHIKSVTIQFVQMLEYLLLVVKTRYT